MRLELTVIFLVPALCAGSSLLTQTARDVLKQPGGRAQAEGFLQQAIAENPNDPEPLTLLGILRQGDLQENPQDLRTIVEPMFEQLLVLREQNPATKPGELALALELNAMILDQVGRNTDAAVLRARAQALRRQIVHDLHSSAPVDLAANPTPGVYRVGQGVSAPGVLSKMDPDYSEEARESRISGTVLVSIIVDAEGRPQQIEIARSLGFGLDEKAAETVAAWRFRPGTKDGQPVPVKASIEVNFRLR